MKTRRRLEYLPKAIRYPCLAVVFVLGLLTIVATGGGGGSSGSGSANTLVSQANVTVLSSNATATPVQGARVEGRFLDKDTNATEVSTCVTDANGRCVVAVAIPGQLADEVTLTVTQPDYYTKADTTPLDSTGSVNAIVRMTPIVP